MSEPQKIMLLTAQTQKLGETQTRAYSDRDVCLADWEKIKGNKRISWTLASVVVDEHKPWFFDNQEKLL